jgi:hypothetical protein
MDNLVLRPRGSQPRQVNSSIGRTERPDVGQRRPEPRSLTEPDDRDVRKPRPLLAAVDAERLEAPMQNLRNGSRSIDLVREDEHPDAPGLAIPRGLEPHRRGSFSGGTCGLDDPRQLVPRPMPQERERDVQVRPGDRAGGPHVLVLPSTQGVEDVLGKAEGAKEPQRFI